MSNHCTKTIQKPNNSTFIKYVDDIEAKCFSLSNTTHHFRTTYPSHKLFGDKVLTYRRNRATVWYIIYTIDMFHNVLVTKIISNYLTIEQ